MNSLKAAQSFSKRTVAKGKKSKLDPHSDAIKFLLDNHYTLLQIQEFLKSDLKLSVSYSNLQGWVKRRFKNESDQDHSKKYIPLEKSEHTSDSYDQYQKHDTNDVQSDDSNKKSGKRYTSSPSTREKRGNYTVPEENNKKEKR